MSIKTFFTNGWADFLNWFGAAEATVVAEGKVIIDELVPVIKADLLTDGSELLTTTTAAIASGTGVAGIAAGATALIPVLAKQGIQLSEAGATVLAAFIASKQAALSTGTVAPAAAPAAPGAGDGTAS